MAPSVLETTIPDTTIAGVPDSIQNPAVARTDNLFTLDNRTVVITGGGRGLGIVLAAAVTEQNGDVVCLDLHEAPSMEEWATVQKLAFVRGVHAFYRKCDITDEATTRQVLQEIATEALQRNRPLRGLITCAGIQQMVPALEYPVEGYRKMLEVKYVQLYLNLGREYRKSPANDGSTVWLAPSSQRSTARASSRNKILLAASL